jgi:hypothetical protein
MRLLYRCLYLRPPILWLRLGRNEITVDSLLAELEQAHALAVKNEQPSAMIAATMGKARLVGLLPNKHVLTDPDGRPPFTAAAESIGETTRWIRRTLGELRVEVHPGDDEPDDDEQLGDAGRGSLSRPAAPRGAGAQG